MSSFVRETAASSFWRLKEWINEWRVNECNATAQRINMNECEWIWMQWVIKIIIKYHRVIKESKWEENLPSGGIGGSDFTTFVKNSTISA